MKILEKKKNGLLKIEYYDKTSQQDVIIDNVPLSVIKCIKQCKRQKDKKQKTRKKYEVTTVKAYEKAHGKFIDPDSNFEEILADEADFKIKKEILTKAMRTLYPRERSIIIMRYYEKKKIKDIAQNLKISTTTVSKTIKRALCRLRTIIDGNCQI